jgi:lysophospholipase L1-like esterase
LGYDLRYNQRTPVNIKLTIIEHGETTKVIVKTDKIENIDFANLSDNLNDAISAVAGEKPTQYGGRQIATFNKGVAIGDSLTAGVFNHNEGGTNAYITNSAFAYPAKLKQLCGVDLTNLGNGGYASDQWWTAHQNDDLSGNQFAIVQLGVNDAIQYQGWTETSVTAFTNIINKLLTENNGIFVFVATIIPATSYQGASYDAVSEGIRTLVESINSDHVILLDMAEYGNTMNEVGYNNGHLSALGYERLALDYIAYISYVIAHNPILFRNIQFIGTNFSYS